MQATLCPEPFLYLYALYRILESISAYCSQKQYSAAPPTHSLHRHEMRHRCMDTIHVKFHFTKSNFYLNMRRFDVSTLLVAIMYSLGVNVLSLIGEKWSKHWVTCVYQGTQNSKTADIIL